MRLCAIKEVCTSGKDKRIFWGAEGIHALLVMPKTGYLWDEWATPPIGIAYVSTYLKQKGVDVTAVNMNLEDDDVVGESKSGFIKMDVEGAERQALTGAREIIRRNRPVLAVSAYHLWDDLFVLPLLIKEIAGDDYKVYLRHHGIAAEELVIYAIPPVND